MKIKVAFIGFGRRGKTLYGSLIKKNNIEVVGINDIKNTENVKYFFSDAKEMIQKVLPDLVIIATPPNLHRHYIEICDDLNVTVLCEKPACTSLTDVLSIRKDQKIYPAYQFLYDPVINKAFELMEKKQILKIVACQRVNNITTEWKSKKKNTGGGTLIDNGSHFISLAIHHFGMPSSVYASIAKIDENIEKECDILLSYDNFTFYIHTSWLSANGKENKISIYGDERDVHYRETNQLKELYENFNEKTCNGWSTQSRKDYFLAKGLDRSIKEDPFNVLANENAIDRMFDFLIEDLKKNQVGQDGRKIIINVHKVIDAAYMSNRQKKMVRV